MNSMGKVGAEMDLVEAVVRQAMVDFRAGQDTTYYESAEAFLSAAGLLRFAHAAIARNAPRPRRERIVSQPVQGAAKIGRQKSSYGGGTWHTQRHR